MRHTEWVSVFFVDKSRAPGVTVGDAQECKHAASGVIAVIGPEVVVLGAAHQHAGIIVEEIPCNAAVLDALHHSRCM